MGKCRAWVIPYGKQEGVDLPPGLRCRSGLEFVCWGLDRGLPLELVLWATRFAPGATAHRCACEADGPFCHKHAAERALMGLPITRSKRDRGHWLFSWDFAQAVLVSLLVYWALVTIGYLLAGGS